MINILSIPFWAVLFSMGTQDAAGFSWKQRDSVKVIFSQSQYCDLISHSEKTGERIGRAASHDTKSTCSGLQKYSPHLTTSCTTSLLK